MTSNDKLAGVQETTRLDAANAFTPEQLAASLTAPQFAPIDLDKLSDQTIEQERLTPTQEDRDVERQLRAAWTDFLDANPDDLTSPEDLPDHALVTCDQFIDIVRNALAAIEEDAALKSPPIAGGEHHLNPQQSCGNMSETADLSTTSGDAGKLCERLNRGVTRYCPSPTYDPKGTAPDTDAANAVMKEAATLLTQMEAREQAMREETAAAGRNVYRLQEVSAELVARIAALEKALEPFARLQLPVRADGNAGFYSILHGQILTVRALLNPTPTEER